MEYRGCLNIFEESIKSLVTSDLGLIAAKVAIENANIDQEKLDYIIFAHNFGDVPYGETQSDAVPSLASRVKHQLGIKNNYCVAYDVIFGCPGYGIIFKHLFFYILYVDL